MRDPLGDPVCRITSCPKENELLIRTYVAAKAEEWLRAAGAIDVMCIALPAEGPNQSWHAVGCTRMGDNLEKNVVDKLGFSHEVPNLGALGRIGDGKSRRAEPRADDPGAGLHLQC